jgi:ankyrin repeat protein
MHITYVYLFLCIQSYCASTTTPSTTLSTKLQKICTIQLAALPETEKRPALERLRNFVRKLEEAQHANPALITLPRTISIPHRHETFFVRYEKRQENLTPLTHAICNKNYYLAVLLARFLPCYIEHTDSQGNTALHYLCRELEHRKCIYPVIAITYELLYHLQSLINVPNNAGVTPIMLATKPRLIAAISMLGGTIYHKNHAGQSALTYEPYPFCTRQVEKLTTLVLLGADPATIRAKDQATYRMFHARHNRHLQEVIAQERRRILTRLEPRNRSIVTRLRHHEQFG